MTHPAPKVMLQTTSLPEAIVPILIRFSRILQGQRDLAFRGADSTTGGSRKVCKVGWALIAQID